MSTSKRYDMHRPSSVLFDPEQYQFRGAFCTELRSSRETRDAVLSLLHRDGWIIGAGSVSQCGHCGAAIKYTALMLRTDAREYIFVGETCLGTRFPLSKDQFQILRTQMKMNRERKRVSDTAAALIAANPVLGRLDELVAASPGNDFFGSIREQLKRKGVLSVNQIAAVARAAERHDTQAVRKAEWAARDAALAASGVNAPEGKGVKVRGKVVTRKTQYSTYGEREVMMVESEEGWKVWSTVPASVLPQQVRGLNGEDITVGGVEVGSTIEFIADLAHFPDSALISKATRPRSAVVTTP